MMVSVKLMVKLKDEERQFLDGLDGIFLRNIGLKGR
jgi:hypothetical protein